MKLKESVCWQRILFHLHMSFCKFSLLIQEINCILLCAHFGHGGPEPVMVLHLLHNMSHVVGCLVLLGYLLISHILPVNFLTLEVICSKHSLDFLKVLEDVEPGLLILAGEVCLKVVVRTNVCRLTSDRIEIA